MLNTAHSFDRRVTDDHTRGGRMAFCHEHATYEELDFIGSVTELPAAMMGSTSQNIGEFLNRLAGSVGILHRDRTLDKDGNCPEHGKGCYEWRATAPARRA